MHGFVFFMIHTFFHPMKKRVASVTFFSVILFKPQTSLPLIGCFQTATIKALTCFCLFGLWPKIQGTRYAGGR